MDIGKDLLMLSPQADQRVNVEKSPVVDLAVMFAPGPEGVVLRLEKRGKP